MPGRRLEDPHELRERAVRMVAEVRGDHDSEWAAMTRVASLLGVKTPGTVPQWVRQAEVYHGRELGIATFAYHGRCVSARFARGVSSM